MTGTGYFPAGEFYLNHHMVEVYKYPELEELVHAAVLCNDAVLQEKDDTWTVIGDPTEGALLSLGMKAGIDPNVQRDLEYRISSIPFESEHRFMATLNQDSSGTKFIFVKGAPETIIERSSDERTETGKRPINPHYWHEKIREIASSGQRTLAVAAKKVSADKTDVTFGDVEGGLVMLGLFGIIDPPREESLLAVDQCHHAGIVVKMITGDHVETARVIGERLNIGVGKPAVTGAELEKMDDAELRRVVGEVDVFARTSPEHKLRLVEALQANGEVTAMTGDGVNDAPALKRANVGLAMGVKGTEAAKEAASHRSGGRQFQHHCRSRQGRAPHLRQPAKRHPLPLADQWRHDDGRHCSRPVRLRASHDFETDFVDQHDHRRDPLSGADLRAARGQRHGQAAA